MARSSAKHILFSLLRGDLQGLSKRLDRKNTQVANFRTDHAGPQPVLAATLARGKFEPSPVWGDALLNGTASPWDPKWLL